MLTPLKLSSYLVWGDVDAIEAQRVLAGDPYGQVGAVHRSADTINRGGGLNLVIGYGVRNITDHRELAYGVACVGTKAVVIKVIAYWAGRAFTINFTGAYVEHSTEGHAVS